MTQGRSFVDLQVNGYCGADFSSASLTGRQIEETCRKLLASGTGGFLATVVTSSWNVYEHVLPLLADACEKPPEGALILGIHLEGPFISPQPGASGAHPGKHILPPSPDGLRKLHGLCKGHLRLLTVAPETSGSADLIRAAARSGITVSLGHTMADWHQIKAAADAGASLATHLGNGTPVMQHRHNNSIAAILASESIRPMIIPDGHHLPYPFIRLIERVCTRRNLIAVSDSSPAAGMPPGNYFVWGQEVQLNEEGRLFCRNNPECLAGSSCSMFECMNFLAENGWTENELWTAGRDNPLEAIQMSDRHIPDADLTWNGSLFIKS